MEERKMIGRTGFTKEQKEQAYYANEQKRIDESIKEIQEALFKVQTDFDFTLRAELAVTQLGVVPILKARPAAYKEESEKEAKDGE